MIDILLPWPPSVNKIWRGGKGRVHRSVAYKAWIEEAIWAIKMGHHHKIIGEFTAKVILTPPDKRKRDMDNLLKPLFDLVQTAGLIEDDSLLQHLEVSWDYNATCGARLILKPVK